MESVSVELDGEHVSATDPEAVLRERIFKERFPCILDVLLHALCADQIGDGLPGGLFAVQVESGCPDSCYIDNIPACAKGLTRDDMLRAKEAMLEMGIDIKDEDAVAGFAVSRKVLGLDRRKK